MPIPSKTQLSPTLGHPSRLGPTFRQLFTYSPATPTQRGLFTALALLFLQILSYRFILLGFVLFLNHFSSLWGMGKMGLVSGQRNDPLRTPPSHRTVVKSWFREVLILLRKQLQTNIANRRQYKQQANCVYLWTGIVWPFPPYFHILMFIFP